MKNNPQLSPKDRNLIRGAIRRVFARCELRREVIEGVTVRGYRDPLRPRVKTFCECQLCGTLTPKSYMVVDHIHPVIPLDKSLEEMSIEEFVNALWCDIINLQAVCPACHAAKTKTENELRRKYKKEKKENERR